MVECPLGTAIPSSISLPQGTCHPPACTGSQLSRNKVSYLEFQAFHTLGHSSKCSKLLHKHTQISPILTNRNSSLMLHPPLGATLLYSKSTSPTAACSPLLHTAECLRALAASLKLSSSRPCIQ